MASTLADVVQQLREAEPATRERMLADLDAEEVADGITALDELLYTWEAWGRPEQLVPADGTRWRFLALRAGRGGGKTRTGAEFVRACAADPDSCAGKIALIAPTHGDIRITMVEGESGVLAVSSPWDRPEWQPGYGHGGRLLWSGTPAAPGQRTAAGDTCEGLCFSAERPNRIRGPMFGAAWGDEYAAWGVRGLEVHDLLNPGLRLGPMPRCLYTSTPKPTPLVEMLDALARAEEAEVAAGTRRARDRVYLQRVWSTFRNALNIPAETIAELDRRYAGTTQGRQELDAELLSRDPDALWSDTVTLIDAHRRRLSEVPELVRRVIAVDNAERAAAPGVIDSSSLHGRNRDAGPNDTGIVDVALGADGHVYVFGDHTVNASPGVWGKRVIEAFAAADADAVVVETNAGGDLIRRNLDVVLRDLGIHRDRVPIHEVTASRGKEARAGPVLTLYEQGRVHHVYTPATAPGAVAPLADLEYQMSRFRRGATGVKKDRVDALVWGVTELISRPTESRASRAVKRAQAYTR